jgi:hypothetical protein
MVDLERFRVEGAVLHVTCGRCGQETTVMPAPGGADAAPPLREPRAPSLPEASAGPAAAATAAVARAESSPSRPPSQPPRISLASSPMASNVVMLRTATVEAVERAQRAAEGDPFEAPKDLCPKCLARRADGPSCPHCGVVFQAFQPDNLTPPQWLRDAWLELLRDWGNDAAHEALRLRAQQEGALTLLGRLYRLRLAVEPADPIAEKGRTDVLRLASAPMSFRPREEPGSRKVKPAVIAVVLLVGAGTVWFMVRFLLQHLVPQQVP